MTNNSGVISNIGYFYMFWMQVSLYPSFWFFILILSSLTHLLIIHNEQKNTIIPLVLLYKNHYTFDVIKLCLYNLTSIRFVLSFVYYAARFWFLIIFKTYCMFISKSFFHFKLLDFFYDRSLETGKYISIDYLYL